MVDVEQKSSLLPFEAIVITAKVSASLSIIGSGLILHDLFVKRKDGLKNTKNQLIAFMSASDIVSSFFLHFIGTWFVPKGLVYGSSGNTATCYIQAIVGTTAVSMSLGFNVALSIYYVLTVRCNYQESNMKRIRKLIILAPIIFSTVVRIPSIFLNKIAYKGTWSCAILSRESAGIYLKVIDIIIISFFIIIFGSMALLVLTVLKQEKTGDRFSFNGSRSRKHTKKVAVQGIFYVGAFFLSMIFYIITSFLRIRQPWSMIALAATVPLQGFLNAVVYFRPRYVIHHKRKQKKGLPKQNQSRSSIFRRADGSSPVLNLPDVFAENIVEPQVHPQDNNVVDPSLNKADSDELPL